MGTIQQRPRQDGSIAYQAQVFVKRKGRAYREQQTFARQAAARAWMVKREAELSEDGAIEALERRRHLDVPLSDVIARYIAESRKGLGRTKTQVLRKIAASDLGSERCSAITSVRLVDYTRELARDRQPQTVANYLSHLGAVLTLARPAWGYPVDEAALKDAFKVTRQLGLTGKSVKRERRPTLAELDALMRFFGEKRLRRSSSLPMQQIVAAAIFTTRRQEELIRLQWSDLDERHARILVRDMKHPGEKTGNHVWCDLPDPALRLLMALPRTDARILPYAVDGISAAFTRACQVLGIEDLHFHDLRHEGVTRLFEMGLSIPRVAAVSGHRSWASLKRYTHMRETGDRYTGWPWLSAVTASADRPA